MIIAVGMMVIKQQSSFGLNELFISATCWDRPTCKHLLKHSEGFHFGLTSFNSMVVQTESSYLVVYCYIAS